MKPSPAPSADPPLWVAWHQARAGIRVRFARHMLTAAGILLGTAFFASMLTLRAAESGSSAAEAQRHLWLAATSLVMCLMGVTNSMLMSVTERYREIGTIKCLGASDGFIVKVFVLEALILGFGGSLAGAGLGVLAMSGGLALSGTSATLSGALMAAGWASLAGLVLTLASAIPPAIQAARMPAAAALRVEV